MNGYLPLERSPRPGYRLQRVELFNWGSFDSTGGEVHELRPEGRSALMVGKNGHGKSTVVDALLTLLVRPGVRNYNVAAGAKKRERDERSYVTGAYDLQSREGESAETRRLRPGAGGFSILLATFANEDVAEAFTVAQVLYLKADQSAERVYCFAEGERSVRADFADLPATDRLVAELKRRGMQATRSHPEYEKWLAAKTRWRPKAMDVFNQTVAVRDIENLNDFIRKHMLDGRSWNDRVERLLAHTAQLSEAHQTLVRARRQSELLGPVIEAAKKHQKLSDKLAAADARLAAADVFFRRQTLELVGPRVEELSREIEGLDSRKDQLGRRRRELEEQCRKLRNEIDRAGGERLRELPGLVAIQEELARVKRTANERYAASLRRAGVEGRATDSETFIALRERLSLLATETRREVAVAEGRQADLLVERARVHEGLDRDRGELESLRKRKGNMPRRLVELRERMCRNLRIATSELPFVAELIAVSPEHRDWEASIEKALRGFALSMLAPGDHYALVSRYVEATRLEDGVGAGQRLTYLRVPLFTQVPPAGRGRSDSLVTKLRFREGRPLSEWVRAELAERHDYRCCETVEEFQETRGPAMTRQRHLKSGGGRHEKDDRSEAVDPRRFVLGWDNKEKLDRLTQAVAEAERRLATVDAQLHEVDEGLRVSRGRLAAADMALDVKAFDEVDCFLHERQAETLRREKRQLEEADDTVSQLKRSLSAVEQAVVAVEAQRDACTSRRALAEKERDDAVSLVEIARSALEQQSNEATREEVLDAIAAELVDPPLTADNLFVREQSYLKRLRHGRADLEGRARPAGERLVRVMGDYLSEFPEEKADLSCSVEYRDEFLARRQRIEEEDLPRHERRFKERLNEKVTQDIGLLRSEFENERRGIKGRVEELNRSLGKLPYREGTHMRLEASDTQNAEIAQFRAELRGCLDDALDDSFEAAEARFLRIRKLLDRLRDETAWRDRVTDVRKWMSFAARELDDATGEERAYYEGSSGKSGGEKAKLAFTVLAAAISYQFDIEPDRPVSDRFHFLVVDEMFKNVDDQNAEYALNLFEEFGLQLLIAAPLDAKARVTEPYVGCYLLVSKDEATEKSEVFHVTARELQDVVLAQKGGNGSWAARPPAPK